MEKRKLILIDPGHGGSDPGAVAANATEASINMRYAHMLGSLLFEEKFDVHFTRYFDQYVSLADRVAIADAIKPDLFLSLHCNSASSPGAHGLEVFTSKGKTRADDAASCLINALVHRYPGTTIRSDWTDGDPDKEADFYVLNNTACPAVLLEMGFLSNPDELEWLLRESTPVLMCTSIISGLLDWREKNAQ